MRLAVVLLIFELCCSSDAVFCELYHDIMESGKRMTILPAVCASERFCVMAEYKDPNRRKKNGFSKGCDRVDCAESEDGSNPLWERVSGTMTCRKHKDYGSKGRICCCTTNMCNTTSTVGVSLSLISLIIFVFLS